MPTACNPRPECSFRNATARAIVGAGDSVENCVMTKSSGPVPTAHTNFVPPPSIAPNTFLPLLCLVSRLLRSTAMQARRRERPKVFFQKQVRVIIAHVGGRMNLLSTESTSRFLRRILLGVLALLGSLLCHSAEQTPTSRITPTDKIHTAAAAWQ